MKLAIIISISLLGISLFISPEAFAQTNPNLFVSAENPLVKNYFAGPMVIEVIIDDPDIKNTDESKGEPDVTVNGKILRMVQATDGKWYAYFADKDQAQIADSTTTVQNIGLDFGTFCGKNDGLILGGLFSSVSVSDTTGVAVAGPVAGGSQGKESIEDNQCERAPYSESLIPVNNVVRQPPIPSMLQLSNQDNGPLIGQIGINPNMWPFIQLYDFSPTGNVVVQYNKGGNVQTVTLTFDNIENFVSMKLDKSSYQSGSDVNLTITDIQLNIDPTDEDSWTWDTSNDGTLEILYQVFDKNGQSAGDGTTLSQFNLNTYLPDLMFGNNGILIMDVDASSSGTDVLAIQDNNDVRYVDFNGNIATNPQTASDVRTQGNTLTIQTQPVTLTEQGKNSGVFSSRDENNKSSIVITNNPIHDTYATIDYNNSKKFLFVSNPSEELIVESELIVTEGFITIDKTSYQKIQGTSIPITVTGEVSPYLRGVPVTLLVNKPDGTIQSFGIPVKSNGVFFTIINLEENWDVGTYQIEMQYNEEYVDSVSFKVVDKILNSDFSIMVSPDQLIMNSGDSNESTIYIIRENHKDEIFLDCIVNNPKINCHIIPTKLTSNNNVAKLIIDTDKTDTITKTMVIVTGNDNTELHKFTVDITINPPEQEFDFTLNMKKKSAIVNPGRSVSVSFDIASTSEYSINAVMDCVTTNPSITCQVPSFVNSKKTYKFELFTSQETPSGEYDILISGNSNSVFKEQTFQLILNQKPTADIAILDSDDSQLLSFNSNSFDGDGTIVKHEWYFGDGKSSSLKSPSHTFEPGSFQVKLTVYDNLGASNSETITVNIDEIEEFWTPETIAAVAAGTAIAVGGGVIVAIKSSLLGASNVASTSSTAGSSSASSAARPETIQKSTESQLPKLIDIDIKITVEVGVEMDE